MPLWGGVPPKHKAEDLIELEVTDGQVEKVDMVNSPPHYTAGGVECIDAIRASMSGEQFRGYAKGCILKYLWRWERKGGVEDLRKAEWYLRELIKATGEPMEEAKEVEENVFA